MTEDEIACLILGWIIAVIAGNIVKPFLNGRDYKTDKKRRPITYDY